MGTRVMLVIDTLGFLIACLSALPQVARTYRTKKAEDISIPSLIVLQTGTCLTTVYAIHVGDLVFISGSILSIASTGVLILLWFKYVNRKNEKGSANP